jgi:putative tryptophan/tyrosine transport system substrate-binding protein
MPQRWSRRQLVQGVGAVGLGLLAGCGRWPGQAQSPARVPRIGILGSGTPEDSQQQAFLQGLGEVGYVEGQNILIERRFAGGHPERLPDLAAELVRLPVDAIAATGSTAISAAKNATSTIPIIMTEGADPVGLGFVASLARPGGNITGMSHLARSLAGKRLELLRELVPGASRVAVLVDSRSPAANFSWIETQRAAQTLGVHLDLLEVRDPRDLDVAFETARSERADGLLAVHANFIQNQRARITQLAAESRLPTMYTYRIYVEAGGLAAYGPDVNDLARRSVIHLDKILKGAQPADLPVEQPTRFDFFINTKTAQALGLTIPPHVLLQATEVIQ